MHHLWLDLTEMGKHDAPQVGEEKKVDILRDTPVRLLGYTNEVGEAFREHIPVSAVRFTYAVSSTYVLVDTYDKAKKASEKQYKSNAEKKKHVAVVATDTLIWQAFASVIIPGLAINRICAFSNYIFKNHTSVPTTTGKWITTAIGLACIPIIFKPIDHFVDDAMNFSIRKLYPVHKTD